MRTLTLFMALSLLPVFGQDRQPSVIWGAVIEVIPSGIIVQCPTTDAIIAAGNGDYIGAAAAKDGAIPVYGVCFLKNYPKQSELADGDRLRVFAYPDGVYSYQATDGSNVTIHSFTAQVQGQ